MKKIIQFLTLSIALLFGATTQGTETVRQGWKMAGDIHCNTDCNTLSCKSFYLFKVCEENCKPTQIKNCTASFCKGCGKSRCKSFEEFEYCKEHCDITPECTSSFCQQCKKGKGPKDSHTQELCQENCSEEQSASEDDSKENDAGE